LQKDRKQTRAGILNAVGRLLAQSGFKDLGVNSIAREAGVDKVLIYRYFGGLADLLKAFAEETDFWPDLPELAHETGQPAGETTQAARVKSLMLAFGRALRERPVTQEIMRWELLERNELTDALARHREMRSANLFEPFEGSEEIDIRAVGSLMAAGLTYLILRSKTVDVYNGLHLNSDADWARIEHAVSFLVDTALDKNRAKPASEASSKTHKEPLPGASE
jgi:AcrR family transcriptional regulator